jgi:hypothetical protein
MAKCDIHPGRDADPNGSFFGKEYCAKCAEQIKKAQSNVRPHISPKECFIIYKGGSTGWEPPAGTGCAHWVAHEKAIKNGFASDRCAVGYSFKIPDVISGARKLAEGEEVRKDDIYVTPDAKHCGLVIRVKEVGEGKDKKQEISIRHCSSTHERGVSDDNFDTHFRGKGSFYRC